jgi:hypothetical protein
MVEAIQKTEEQIRQEGQDLADAVKELRGAICRPCGGPKRPMQSFCRDCFMALPKKMRDDLYKTIQDGYAVVYKEAKEHLGRVAK